MNGSELGAALHAGKRVYGTCIISAAPQWPAMIAGAGLDFVFLDTEHIVLDRTQLSWMCQTYSALNLAPIVRIPSPDPFLAGQVIDGGAAGVIAPYVESVDQVRDLRGAVKLRPLKGERLARVLNSDEQLADHEQEYLANYNRGNLCIVNIESVPAINALDQLLAVPDIDALLIGPHDLSINLGIPEQYDHPTFQQAVRTIFQKGRDAGVGVGMHYSGADGITKMNAWATDGMNLIIHSSDLRIVGQTLRQQVSEIRQEQGDLAEPTGQAGDSEVHV